MRRSAQRGQLDLEPTAVFAARGGTGPSLLVVCFGLILLLLQGKGKPSIEKPSFFAIGLLTLANISIAVLWH